ncbi:antibiotic biosynthesis monooxygenase [Alkalihalobacillus sp. MEB130]|uniref:antibiotic biosynthesis monooxygenase family protein n=1 Tax=Alkalihalobacillus sp. MEB130 TaxID=2976704 RepID=UPI0028DF243A|nr:antibiotic biosynthesis monooxygenase [Alkalihalobacillus sp. MEB130]MDT8862006.1 antibiotic biosynthesis monooxygenase [Alkalihalobacillus sp. MEB130]
MKHASMISLSNETSGVTGLLMKGDSGSVVYVEEKVEDHTAKQYEILSETGALHKEGYVVINNIPVSEEGRSSFEERFMNRAGLVEGEPGFQAIRILRPITDDTYAIMTIWDDEASFTNWRTSKSYENAHKKRGTSQALPTTIFPRPSFVTTYFIK